MDTATLILTSFFLGVLLSLIFIYASRRIIKPRETGDKLLVYESGVKPLPSIIVYFARRYFKFILAYIVFDIIASFLVILVAEESSPKILQLYLGFTVIPAIIVFASYYAGLLRWR